MDHRPPKAHIITSISLHGWKGVIGKICRQHCAIGLLVAAMMHERPISATAANKRKTALGKNDRRLQLGLEVERYLRTSWDIVGTHRQTHATLTLIEETMGHRKTTY